MNNQISRLAVASIVLVTSLIVGTTYWQAWAAPGLAEKDLSQSLYAHLRAEGVPPTHCEQSIEAAAPTPQRIPVRNPEF